MDKDSDFLTNLRPQLRNSFPKFLLSFSIPISILSRNMCESRRKLRNAKIYPLEVLILQIIVFNVILWTIWAVNPHI